MPWREASLIELTEKQESILKGLAKGTHVPLHLQQRSQIVLMASEGLYNNTIKHTLEISLTTVKKWRNRFSLKGPEINRVEKESPRKLRGIIKEALSDEPRPGAPPTYTDEEVATIILISCEDPQKYHLPVSHWTPSLLKQTLDQLGIAKGISTTHIARLLKREGFAAPSHPVLAQSKR